MRSFSIVVVLEAEQLPFQVPRIPERHVIEVLAPDRTDQPLHERVRHRYIGHGLDLSNLKDAEIGIPALKLEQRVIV